jgi:hypothetical protein
MLPIGPSYTQKSTPNTCRDKIGLNLTLRRHCTMMAERYFNASGVRIKNAT